MYKQTAYRVSIVTIFFNVLLTLFKLWAGLVGHSLAMISDALHSLSDVISTAILMVGIHFSTMKADRQHPYGHERIECISSLILSFILIFTGLQIAYQSLTSLFQPHDLHIPSRIAFIAAIISIIIKELLYHYTKHYTTKLQSTSLLADAWHHRSDALSSIGSFIGIGLSILGYPLCDSFVGLFMSLFILKPGLSIFYHASISLVDHSCSDDIYQSLFQFIQSQEGVLHIDVLKTRMFAEKYYVDLEISVDQTLSLQEAHCIAHRVHDHLEQEFPNIKHCMIHVNPNEK